MQKESLQTNLMQSIRQPAKCKLKKNDAKLWQRGSKMKFVLLPWMVFNTKEHRLTLILIPILSYLLVFEETQVKITLFSLKFTMLQKLKIWNIIQNHSFAFVRPKVILVTIKNENQCHGWHAIYFICLVLKTYHFSSSTFDILFSKSYFYS